MRKIKSHFDSFEAAWRAPLKEYVTSGIDEKTAETIELARRKVDPDQEMLRLEKNGVSLIEESDSCFPKILKEIPSPVFWLYVKGKIINEENSLAIVGSRKATSYGKEAVDKIVSGLAMKTSVTIISGLAIGIDGESHRAAIKHDLRTIAVIGSGLDDQSFFPPQHLTLFRNIAERGGAVISEYPPGTPAFKQNFVQRNRIISGLAKGTLIIEAAEKSGALITANFALEQGKSVMAVPGPIFSPYSRGTNALIGEGARIITSAEDVIDELGLEIKKPSPSDERYLTDNNEGAILENLDKPSRIDELVGELNLPAADIISCLSMLELKGVVKNINGEWIKL